MIKEDYSIEAYEILEVYLEEVHTQIKLLTNSGQKFVFVPVVFMIVLGDVQRNSEKQFAL